MQKEMREDALISMRKFADPNFNFKEKEKGRNFDYSKEKIIELKTNNDKINMNKTNTSNKKVVTSSVKTN